MEHPLTHSLIDAELPEMELKIFHNNEIKSVKLSDYRGKWLILFFYPSDFTFVCPTELTELADNYPLLTSLNTEVLSVSTDTAFVHKAWHDHSPSIKKITYPMAADPAGKLCKLMGTYIHDSGISLRATFIIDPDGLIKSYEFNNNSIGRNAQELIRKLQAAQYVHEHGAEVCPAAWKPGEKTLTPGIDLVGKI